MSSRRFGASIAAAFVFLATSPASASTQIAGAQAAAPASQEPVIVMPLPAVPLKLGTMTYRATIALGGQTREMAVTTEIKDDPDGWLITDTATTPAFEPGYPIAFRTFDVQVKRVRIVQLRLLGSESVTVPAGTFDAFKIELSTADDGARTTVWVVKDSRRVAKIVGVRPQFQGAALTSELVK